MSARYVFTHYSREDYINIRRYTLKKWGEKQSKHYLNDLKKTFELIAEMPLMGENCLESLGKEVYRFPSGSHIIYYLAASNKEIVIFAILHQRMLPQKHLDNR